MLVRGCVQSNVRGSGVTRLTLGVIAQDFHGGHPDPNLVYAHELVHIMGTIVICHCHCHCRFLVPHGCPVFGLPHFRLELGRLNSQRRWRGRARLRRCRWYAFVSSSSPLVIGRKFFVTPSDSVAVIAANAHVIPFFHSAGGLKV